MEIETEDSEDEMEKREESGARVRLVLDKGWRLGKKMVITGIAVSSAPFLLPPLALIYVLGFAFSVPFSLIFASYAYTDKLMRTLLPINCKGGGGDHDDAFDEEVEEGERENALYVGEIEDDDGRVLAEEDKMAAEGVGGVETAEMGETERGFVEDDVEVADEKVKEEAGHVGDMEGDEKGLQKEDETEIGQDGGAVRGEEEQEDAVEEEKVDEEVLGREDSADGISEREEMYENEKSGDACEMEKVEESIEMEKHSSESTEDDQTFAPNENEKADSVVEVGEDRKDVEQESTERGEHASESTERGEHASESTKRAEQKENVREFTKDDGMIANEEQSADKLGDAGKDEQATEREENVGEINKDDGRVTEEKNEAENAVDIEDDKERREIKEQENVTEFAKDDKVDGSEEQNAESFGEIGIDREVEESGENTRENTENGGRVTEKEKVDDIGNSEESKDRQEVEEEETMKKFPKDDKMIADEEKKADNLVKVEENKEIADTKENVRETTEDDGIVIEVEANNVGKVGGDEEVLEGGENSSGDNANHDKVIVDERGNADVDTKTSSKSSEQDSGAADAEKEVPVEISDTSSKPVPVEISDTSSKPITGFASEMEAKPTNEPLYSEEEIWEQIKALRLIVGYKAALHASYVEELKALYLFTGVEPPASFKDSSDLIEVNDKLRFLKAVVGVM